MPQYLVGIMFHEPEAFELWNRGIIEDYESSTGLFVDADSPTQAIAWGENVGQQLLRHVNRDDSLDWKVFGYHCWIEPSPSTSSWNHCLDFFLQVRVGQIPDLDQMGTEAYRRWQERQSNRTNNELNRP